MPSRRTRRAVVLVVAAALPLLASCADRTDAAATVGDETISGQSLRAEVLEVRETYGSDAVPDSGELLRERLRQRILDILVTHVADEEGVEVTGSQVDEIVDGAVEQSGGDRAAFLQSQLLTEDTLEQIARFQVLIDELGVQLGGNEGLTAAVVGAEEDLGVTVSRRYGTWDAENLSIVATGGSIATEPLAPPLDTAPE